MPFDDNLFESEAYLNAHMDAYYDYIRECILRLNPNEKIALALLNILIEEKGGKRRKDGTTPHNRHQCDQAMYTFGILGDFQDKRRPVPFYDPIGVVRLNIGHDHVEDIFSDPKELLSELRLRCSANYDDALDREIQKTVSEILLMSKKYAGDLKDSISNYDFHRRVLTNRNTAVARLQDIINNGSTKSRIPKKNITEQAEDADRVSTLILYPHYAAGMPYVETYTQVASRLHPTQATVFELLETQLKHILAIERNYHDLHPEAKRPDKSTGAPLVNPRLFPPVDGFSRLPEAIQPAHMLYEHICVAHPDLPRMDTLPAEPLRASLVDHFQL